MLKMFNFVFSKFDKQNANTYTVLAGFLQIIRATLYFTDPIYDHLLF